MVAPYLRYARSQDNFKMNDRQNLNWPIKNTSLDFVNCALSVKFVKFDIHISHNYHRKPIWFVGPGATGTQPPGPISFFLYGFRKKKTKQECIPVGCEPPAAVAVCWGVSASVHAGIHLPGPGPGHLQPDPPTSPLSLGLDTTSCEQNDWQTGVKT